LKLEQFEKCVEDCDSALFFAQHDLAGGKNAKEDVKESPEEQAAREKRVALTKKKLLARRGAAFLQSGQKKKGNIMLRNIDQLSF
jgi:hypothetical protein